MSGNVFQQPRPEHLVALPDGISGFLELTTSKEIELQRLEAKLSNCSDWRVAKQIQEGIDRLNST